MATHYLADHTVGPLEPGAAIVEVYLAEEASIPLWGPAALVAAGSGEYVARAGPTETAGDQVVIGVFVGPLRDAGNGYVSDAVGQAVQVLTFGKGKCKVDGASDNIAVGDALVSHGADGVAQLAAADPSTGDTYSSATTVTALQHMNAIFAIALYASTVDLDIIPVHVVGGRGTQT